jgi:hypothetical protein
MGSLKEFLNASANSVTRERLFYNRFYYDLKLAAAHRGVALTVYEPEVDRDGFDVVVDDGDVTRFIQLKTVLASSATAVWRTKKRFLRPDLTISEAEGIPPSHSGKGGAIVLIRIDAAQYDPQVSYFVTDYMLLKILASVLGCKRRGASNGLLQNRRQLAYRAWMELYRGSSSDGVRLSKQLFLKVKNAAGVLALLDLHSEYDCYLPGTSLILAEKQGFQVENDGSIPAEVEMGALAHAHQCASKVLEVLDEPGLALHPGLANVGQGVP